MMKTTIHKCFLILKLNWLHFTFLIKRYKGIALNGHLKAEDVNLASSTLLQDGKSTGDACGIVISYSVRIKLNCGTLGGEMQTDVPFKLLQPAPGKLTNKQKKHLQ